MPRLSKIGAAALAAFGWTGITTQTVSASYIVVAAGGGGGGYNNGGGGGAGGFQNGTATLDTSLTYTITVGAGGVGGNTATGRGTNGTNSSFSAIVTASVGGGGGGGFDGVSAGSAGLAGGSGGGGGAGSISSGGAGTAGQGNNGGTGNLEAGGGGGGASAVGANAARPSVGVGVGGNGGAGTASTISGISVTYAGGGGGGANAVTGSIAGVGGAGGGGTGSRAATTQATSGTANLGGGGGGQYGGSTLFGGAGGSGVVVISYPSPQKFSGGVVTTSGGNVIHTFTTSGTLGPIVPLVASYLIVAGGGGGGSDSAGGGGAGGFLTGSNVAINENLSYLVTVGAGGAGGTSTGVAGANGGNSSFSGYATSAIGGGGGGGRNANNAASGGSGGGGAGDTTNTLRTGAAGTVGQGNAGGNGVFGATAPSIIAGGGGGGAGAVGSAGISTGVGGNGGNGLASSISGISVTYAGGGGGGEGKVSVTAAGGTGGSGGGGNGAGTSTAGSIGFPGAANTGGGGGGGGRITTPGTGGAGGSGVVIISYPSPQKFSGGVVTLAGGDVVHTFNSTGYLTPLTFFSRSLRFRSSASAFLNKTNVLSPTNAIRWTWSGWIKRGTLGVAQTLVGQCNSSSDDSYLQFRTDNALTLGSYSGAGTDYGIITTAVFRDPSAWYHLVAVLDTANATAADRAILYVNGVRQTVGNAANGIWPQSSTNNKINAASEVVNIGRRPTLNDNLFDGYLTEINFIDGQALNPSSFGAIDNYGTWQPITYNGSYGTNGFSLPFSDTTSTTTLGYDVSPQGNNWTPNNFSLLANSTYDSMIDVPTPYDDGGNGRGNYCTLNPLINPGSRHTISQGNLAASLSTAADDRMLHGTVFTSSGKWYFEYVFTGGTSVGAIGIATNTAITIGGGVPQANSVIYLGNGAIYRNGTNLGTFTTYAANNVIGVAFNLDALTVAFYKNNTLVTTVTSVTADTYSAGVFGNGIGDGLVVNFGQRPFAYTPPTGFKALNTQNLPVPTIEAGNKWMDATIYTGNGSTQTITNSGAMQPDLVWIKGRSGATDHALYDSVRGATLQLESNTTTAETTEAQGVTAFTSAGFTIGSLAQLNTNAATYVGWQWKESTTAGLDIVSYTGAGVVRTVAHNLGVAPNMIIVKARNTAAGWFVYHTGLTTPANNAVFLNTTAAESNSLTYWSNTVATSSVFTVGTASTLNGTNYISYVFANVPGFSQFGKYTGNGSADGPFVYCGFRPRFLTIKRIDGSGGWITWDSSRNQFNVTNSILYLNTSGAEINGPSVDLLSNGFKLRGVAADINASAGVYVYSAFAENPFKYANAR